MPVKLPSALRQRLCGKILMTEVASSEQSRRSSSKFSHTGRSSLVNYNFYYMVKWGSMHLDFCSYQSSQSRITVARGFLDYKVKSKEIVWLKMRINTCTTCSARIVQPEGIVSSYISQNVNYWHICGVHLTITILSILSTAFLPVRL